MIYFLIPTYNDADNLNGLVLNISKNIKERKKIILVDDGSTDKTKSTVARLSKNFPVKLLTYEKNTGPGFAFKTGFLYIHKLTKPKDIIVTMEADNTSDYSILKKMIKLSNKYDVVLSSPYQKGGKFIGISPHRKILSALANYLDELIFKLGVKTTSSFYRAYRSSAIDKIIKKYNGNFISEDGFESVVEILIKLKSVKSTFMEVPAVVDWSKRVGKSKMKVIKNIKRHLKLYLNYFSGKYSI